MEKFADSCKSMQNCVQVCKCLQKYANLIKTVQHNMKMHEVPKSPKKYKKII